LLPFNEQHAGFYGSGSLSEKLVSVVFFHREDANIVKKTLKASRFELVFSPFDTLLSDNLLGRVHGFFGRRGLFCPSQDHDGPDQECCNNKHQQNPSSANC
jgi:hypothetical protein